MAPKQNSKNPKPDNDAAQAAALAEADAQAKADADAKAQAEADALAKADADAKDTSKKPKSSAKFTKVVVIGPKGGRWRIGRHFGPEPTEIPLDDLNEAEGLALQDDPTLAVSVI